MREESGWAAIKRNEIQLVCCSLLSIWPLLLCCTAFCRAQTSERHRLGLVSLGSEKLVQWARAKGSQKAAKSSRKEAEKRPKKQQKSCRKAKLGNRNELRTSKTTTTCTITNTIGHKYIKLQLVFSRSSWPKLSSGASVALASWQAGQRVSLSRRLSLVPEGKAHFAPL